MKKLEALRSRTLPHDGANHIQHFSSPSKSKSKSKSQFQSQHQYHNDDEKSDKYEHTRRNNSTFLRIFWIRKWRHLEFRSKIIFFLIAALVLQQVIFKIWDQCFSQIGGIRIRIQQDDDNIIPDEKIASSSFYAVVINTFRRPEMLNNAVQHYAETCGKKYRVGQVFIVWADQERDAPESGSFFTNIDNNLRGNVTSETILTQQQNLNNRVDVEVLIKAKDSLNSRFEPIPQLKTTSVFMVDDDIRVTCSSLLLAFQAWKKHPNSMVGYYPRLASSPTSIQKITSTMISGSSSGSGSGELSSSSSSRLVYNAWPIVWWRQKFNIILTKASFIHSKYLELYTNDDYFPKEIKDHVDRNKNCEDIAMSMLVANFTKHDRSSSSSLLSKTTTTSTSIAPPIYVEGQVSDLGLFGGISTSNTGHFATRSDCLTQLTEIFHSKGWKSPLDDEFDLTERSWIRHAPGFWWQSNPSNVFEWFTLANIIF
ncbi:MAG: hypothetical protein ACI8RD_011300 [Bacillariaceae sp.]|jgi:hypothetical protein